MSTTKVAAPQPSAAEIALQEQQTEMLQFQQGILESQQEMNELLQPFIFEQLGINPVFANDNKIDKQISRLEAELAELGTVASFATGGEGGFRVGGGNAARISEIQQEIEALENQRGTIVGFDETPKTEAELLQEQIQLGLLERTQAALAGELPDNPALLSDLREQEETLRERLLAQLGPGFETSTAGIQALDQFFETEAGILEGSRRGDLSLAESLSLSRDAFQNNVGQQQFGNIFQAGQFNLPLAGGVGSLASGFGQALQPHQFNRNMAFQAAQFNAQQADPFGTLFGTVAGNLAGNPSLFGP